MREGGSWDAVPGEGSCPSWSGCSAVVMLIGSLGVLGVFSNAIYVRHDSCRAVMQSHVGWGSRAVALDGAPVFEMIDSDAISVMLLHQALELGLAVAFALARTQQQAALIPGCLKAHRRGRDGSSELASRDFSDGGD